MSLKFKINQPHVVAENFDNEVVAINLETGSYYSLEKSGATVWSLLSAGATLSEIIAGVNARYQGDPAVITQSIQQFIADLQHAQLIVAQPNGGHTDLAKSFSSTALPLEKAHFEPPILAGYDDMQDLLLLDPIHEVDNQGWPQQKSV